MSGSVTDFASAGLRHVRDAEYLLSGPHVSRDQAWHLAGFAHECVRKAYIGNGWVPKLLGHDFSDAGEQVVDFAVALDPRVGRFPVDGWALRYPAVSAWRPEHRYERTGSTESSKDRQVKQLVADARLVVDACIASLFLDGSLSLESIR